MLKGPIAILIADATVAGLVGNNVEGTKPKVYPMVVPQGEADPYIACRMNGKTVVGKQLGCGFNCQFSVTSFHKQYDGVEALDTAVIAALHNQSGTFEGVVFGAVMLVQGSADDFSIEHQLYSKTSIFECLVED